MSSLRLVKTAPNQAAWHGLESILRERTPSSAESLCLPDRQIPSPGSREHSVLSGAFGLKGMDDESASDTKIFGEMSCE